MMAAGPRETRLTCLIVDDEPLARARLRALARDVAWLEVLGEAATARAAIHAIDELTPDLVFLDVRLPGMSGLEVLRRVQHAPAVVFTTAYDQFAVPAFEIGAVDYLLKPFGRERFQRAMSRARPFLERQAGTAASDRAGEVFAKGAVPRLFVRDGGRIVPIATAAIDRIEACDDYVVVHAGPHAYRLNLQLSELETRLDPATFLRIHRSHMVNVERVASIEPHDGSRYRVTLRGGAAIVASRQRSRAIREIVAGRRTLSDR